MRMQIFQTKLAGLVFDHKDTPHLRAGLIFVLRSARHAYVTHVLYQFFCRKETGQV